MTLTASQADWLRVRSYLQEHRHALAVDAATAADREREQSHRKPIATHHRIPPLTVGRV